MLIPRDLVEPEIAEHFVELKTVTAADLRALLQRARALPAAARNGNEIPGESLVAACIPARGAHLMFARVASRRYLEGHGVPGRGMRPRRTRTQWPTLIRGSPPPSAVAPQWITVKSQPHHGPGGGGQCARAL